MVQTKPNAKESGPFWTAVTTNPMPRMEKGAADSISIAAALVYILDISGGRTSCESALMRRIRKQIIEVRIMFKLTLSEAHGTASWIGLPPSRDVWGIVHSTSVIIEITAKKKRCVKSPKPE